MPRVSLGIRPLAAMAAAMGDQAHQKGGNTLGGRLATQKHRVIMHGTKLGRHPLRDGLLQFVRRFEEAAFIGEGTHRCQRLRGGIVKRRIGQAEHITCTKQFDDLAATVRQQF